MKKERKIYDVFVNYKHYAEYFLYHQLHYNILGPFSIFVMIFLPGGKWKAKNLDFARFSKSFLI